MWAWQNDYNMEKRKVRQSNFGPGGKPDLLFTISSTVRYNFQGIFDDQEDIDVGSQVFLKLMKLIIHLSGRTMFCLTYF